MKKKSIPNIITELNELFKSQKINGEIIVVDDSSPDGTAAEVEKIQKKISNIFLLKDNPKKGIGKALAKGYEFAQGKWLLSMDADGSIKTSEIKLLLKEQKKGFEFIIGSKYIKGADYKKNKLKDRIKSKISEYGNRYISIISGVPIRDFSLNFRLLRKDVWNSIRPKDNENFFLVEMLVQAHRKGYKIKEVPTSFLPRKHGQSKTMVWKQSLKFFIRATRYLWNKN